MVKKNNNEAGAQGKTEGFYGSPYKAGSRVLAVIWRFHSVPSNHEVHRGTRPFTGKENVETRI